MNITSTTTGRIEEDKQFLDLPLPLAILKKHFCQMAPDVHLSKIDILTYEYTYTRSSTRCPFDKNNTTTTDDGRGRQLKDTDNDDNYDDDYDDNNDDKRQHQAERIFNFVKK